MSINAPLRVDTAEKAIATHKGITTVLFVIAVTSLVTDLFLLSEFIMNG